MDTTIHTTRSFIYRAPRVLALLFIGFLAMMSLDVFEGDYGIWETIVALFMHNIPALILIIALILAWKREIIGTRMFLLAGIAYMVMIENTILNDGFEWSYVAWVAIISGVAFLIAFLFRLSGRNKKEHRIPF